MLISTQTGCTPIPPPTSFGSNRLTDEQAEELDVLMAKNMEIYPQELEKSFIMGFKTGARLMCEIFSEETE